METSTSHREALEDMGNTCGTYGVPATSEGC